MQKIVEQTWRKYYEALESLRMAKDRFELGEITQEEFDQIWDSVEIIMSELEDV